MTTSMFLNNNNNENSDNNISILSPTNMMNTLSLHSTEDLSFNSNMIESVSNDNISVKRLSLTDITVSEILETYKDDTDLLKHILAAKTEEDKRKSAEELRKAEEARLHSKFIDLQLEQSRRSSIILDNTSLGLSHNDWLSQVSSSSNNLLSPSFLHNTPPSPSNVQPLSPYTLFDMPYTDLNLSSPSSPEPKNKNIPTVMVEKISLSDDPPLNANTNVDNKEMTNQFPHPPPPPPNTSNKAMKRTFSRTRSTRKPSVRTIVKKNRYLQQPQPDNESVKSKNKNSSTNNEQEATNADILPKEQSVESQESDDNKSEDANKVLDSDKEVKGDDKKEDSGTLDHDKVMEALRAKLKRSSQQLKEQKNVKDEITSMSPSGILLLDLKNPKKSFPLRARATPRASVIKKPNSFISAHKPKEPNVNN